MQKRNLDSIHSIYKLSPMQEGMIFHKIFNEKSQAYFIQMSFDIKKELVFSYLQQSFNIVMERYDILRTNFYYSNIKKMRQVVYKERKEKINYIDISDKIYKEQEEFIENFKKLDRDKNFDLTKDNLMRISLIKRKEDWFSMILSFHHIIMDGWSIGIILNEFFMIYNSLLKGKNIDLDVPIPYKKYIEWLETQDQDELIQYWKSYLKGYEKKAQIPRVFYKKNSGKYDSKAAVLTIDSEITKKLVALSNRNNVTLGITIQTIWGILLQKYNSTNDVVFGMVVSGRSAEIKGIEKMVGMMVNNIPVRIRSKENMEFTTLLKLVNEESLKSQRYHYGSLAEIQAASVLKNQLIDHVLVYENYPSIDVSSVEDDLIIDNIETFEQTNYDFSIIVLPGEKIQFKFYYNNQVYDDDYINGIASNLKELINEIVLSNKTINNLNMLSDVEKEKLLVDFNDTDTKWKIDKTIIELFEEQVEKTPNNIAVVYKDQKLTYRELNNKANALAYKLREKGIVKEDYIAIMAEKSIEMIVGIYGIIKSGAAYVPIDMAYPKERIKYILKDCKPKIMLLYKPKIEKEILGDITIIDLEKCDILESVANNPIRMNSPNDLLYVIYTSGTTGKPKGVMIENRGVANLKEYFINTLRISNKDKILQFANISFDVSVWEMNMAFLCGAELIIPPSEFVLEPKKLVDYCKKKKVTVASLTPNYYSKVSELDLKILITGGTEPSRNLLDKMGNTKYINAYGPTETTICATYWEYLNYKDEIIDRIPIGRPIINTQIYILKNMELCGIGITGELCISGDGLARGYLNRSDLTKEKFVDNPYRVGQKMYRTGDLARWLPDGNIEFLGRIDQQVKIRGYRIELGEIESEIRNIKSIQDVAVIVRESKNGNKTLVAYVVSEQEIEEVEIKDKIREKLPTYMLPHYIIQIDKIPLTINGKINLKELPDVNESNMNRKTESDFVRPRNVTEFKMTYIWKELLDLQNISIDDNFFEIGGNSLLLIKMINEIKKEFNKVISIKDIYRQCTIRKISYYILNNSDDFDENLGEIYENSVLIRKGKENSKNIFFIPDGTGDPSAFIYIVEKLTDDYTCWGLLYNLSRKNYPQNTSIPEEAEKMLNTIKKIQNRGPYNLVAFCSGGYIATEIINLLESEKDTVDHVLFIEVMPLEFKDKELDKLYPKWIKYTVDTEILFIEENLKGISYDEHAIDVENFWNKVICLNRDISKNSLDSIKDAINPIFRTSRNDFDTMSFEQLVKHINTVRSAQNAVVQCKREYKKYVLNAKVDFVFASEQNSYRNEFSNWNEIFINASKYNVIAGTHFGIMRGEGGNKIAGAINENF